MKFTLDSTLEMGKCSFIFVTEIKIHSCRITKCETSILYKSDFQTSSANTQTVITVNKLYYTLSLLIKEGRGQQILKI